MIKMNWMECCYWWGRRTGFLHWYSRRWCNQSLGRHRYSQVRHGNGHLQTEQNTMVILWVSYPRCPLLWDCLNSLSWHSRGISSKCARTWITKPANRQVYLESTLRTFLQGWMTSTLDCVCFDKGPTGTYTSDPLIHCWHRTRLWCFWNYLKLRAY